MRIIPAIDIIDGKCVRLTKGDFNDKTVYDSNPLDVAKCLKIMVLSIYIWLILTVPKERE